MIRRLLERVAGGAARAILTRAFAILASFLLTIAVARLLGVEQAGSFFLASTTLVVISSFGKFGVDNLALKICGGEPARVRVELIYISLFAVMTSVLAMVFVLGVLMITGYRLPGLSAVWLPVVLSSALPQGFAIIAGSILRGRGRLSTGIIAELGSLPALSILLLLLFQVSGMLTLTTALLALAAASWITGLWSVGAALATFRAERQFGDRFSAVGFRRFVVGRARQLSSMMGSSLLFYLLTWSPLFALSIESSLANVSYYTAAARFANLVALVPSIQVAYLSPAFARYFHRNEIPELNALAQRSVRQAAVLLLLPVAVLAGASSFIVHVLYGATFAPAAAPLSILAVSVFVIALLGQVNPLMLLCDLESHALIQSLILVALWATAGLWVANQFGAVGVAWFGASAGILYAVSAARLLRTRRRIHPSLSLAGLLRATPVAHDR